MVIVDSTIVQVALPSIGREFGVSVNGLQWIVTAYGLALAGFLMLSGRGGISTVTRSCYHRSSTVFSGLTTPAMINHSAQGQQRQQGRAAAAVTVTPAAKFEIKINSRIRLCARKSNLSSLTVVF